MVHGVLLVVHIGAGALGLVLGAVAMVLGARRSRRHGWVGKGYQACVLALVLSALGLVIREPGRLWWLGAIAVATEAAALGGWWVRRRRRPGWLPVHLQLMCGSYVSFLTAALVVNWSSPLAWLLPTVVASPAIAVAASRAGRPGARAAVAMPGGARRARPLS